MKKTTGFYREIAWNYAVMCNWEKAIEFYKKALDVFPEIPEGATLLRADYEALSSTLKELEQFVRTER